MQANIFLYIQPFLSFFFFFFFLTLFLIIIASFLVFLTSSRVSPLLSWARVFISEWVHLGLFKWKGEVIELHLAVDKRSTILPSSANQCWWLWCRFYRRGQLALKPRNWYIPDTPDPHFSNSVFGWNSAQFRFVAHGSFHLFICSFRPAERMVSMSFYWRNGRPSVPRKLQILLFFSHFIPRFSLTFLWLTRVIKWWQIYNFI